MCGRFQIDFSSGDLIKRYPFVEITNFPFTSKECAPTNQIFIIEKDHRFILSTASWGFSTSKSKTIINARIETIDEKPMFQAPFAYHHCIIPISGFYEWDTLGLKSKYYVQHINHTILSIAGLYRFTPTKKEVVMITTSAKQPLSSIHDRCPLLIDGLEKEWLDSSNKDEWFDLAQPLQYSTPNQQLSLF